MRSTQIVDFYVIVTMYSVPGSALHVHSAMLLRMNLQSEGGVPTTMLQALVDTNAKFVTPSTTPLACEIVVNSKWPFSRLHCTTLCASPHRMQHVRDNAHIVKHMSELNNNV